MAAQEELRQRYFDTFWKHRWGIAVCLSNAAPPLGALIGGIAAEAANGNIARMIEAINQPGPMPADLAARIICGSALFLAGWRPFEQAEGHMANLKQSLRDFRSNFPNAVPPLRYTLTELLLQKAMPLFDRSALPYASI